MNRSRRNSLRLIQNKLLETKTMTDLAEVQELVQKARDQLEEVSDEEQDAYDGLPDNLMWSIRADNIRDCLDDMNDMLQDFDMALVTLESTEEYSFSIIKKEVNSILRSIRRIVER